MSLEIKQAIAILIFAILYWAAIPTIAIVAINTLFSLAIPITFINWLYMAFLISILTPKKDVSK